MEGIVKVINMLGLTISQLQEELAEAKAEIALLKAEKERKRKRQ